MKFITAITVPAVIAALTLSACSAEETTAAKPDTKPTATQAEMPTAKPKTEDGPAPKPKPTMTTSQQNAVQSAEDYLDYSAFSKKGLIEQLSSSSGEGFPRADAKFAVSHIDVDWNEQAVKSAKEYLENDSFSRSGLLEQLSSSAGEGFTLGQAEHAVSEVYGGSSGSDSSDSSADQADDSASITYPYSDGGGATLYSDGHAIDKDGHRHYGATVNSDGLIAWTP
jgi:hypothetical protein